MIELADKLQLQVVAIGDSYPTDLVSTSGNCSHLLEFSWSPLFEYEGSSESHLHNVTFSSYVVTSLICQLCLSPIKTGDDGHLEGHSCAQLDGAVFVVSHRLNITLLDLQESTLSVLFPAGGNGDVWVWLYLELWLANGSMLHVTSEKVEVSALVPCTRNTGTGYVINP